MSKPSRVLGLFAKEPRPGCVKTRLAAATSAEWATQVADAFLRDLLVRSTGIEAERVLAGIDGIEFIYFSEKDVVRHKLVQMIIKAYETHTKKSEI